MIKTNLINIYKKTNNLKNKQVKLLTIKKKDLLDDYTY